MSSGAVSTTHRRPAVLQHDSWQAGQDMGAAGLLESGRVLNLDYNNCMLSEKSGEVNVTATHVLYSIVRW